MDEGQSSDTAFEGGGGGSRSSPRDVSSQRDVSSPRDVSEQHKHKTKSKSKPSSLPICTPIALLYNERMNALVVRKQSETAIQSDAESRPASPTTPRRLSALAAKLGGWRKRRASDDTDAAGRKRRPEFDIDVERDAHDDDVTVEEGADDEKVSCLRRYCKHAIALVTSQLGLLILLVGYAFFGGGLFQWIESPHEEDEKANLARERRLLTELAWSLAVNESGFDNFTALFDELLSQYDRASKKAFEHGIMAGDDLRIWDYWGSLFFSTTVFTTVGRSPQSSPPSVGHHSLHHRR